MRAFCTSAATARTCAASPAVCSSVSSQHAAACRTSGVQSTTYCASTRLSTYSITSPRCRTASSAAAAAAAVSAANAVAVAAAFLHADRVAARLEEEAPRCEKIRAAPVVGYFLDHNNFKNTTGKPNTPSWNQARPRPPSLAAPDCLPVSPILARACRQRQSAGA